MSTLGRRAFGALILLLFVAGCGGGSTKKMAGLGYRANVVSQPRSVVLAPVARSNILGQSIPDRFLATITQPLAERGYYVMPVRLTTEIAIQEGFTPYLRKRTVEREKKTRFGGAMVTYGDSYLNFDSEDAASIKEIATELAA